MIEQEDKTGEIHSLIDKLWKSYPSSFVANVGKGDVPEGLVIVNGQKTTLNFKILDKNAKFLFYWRIYNDKKVYFIVNISQRKRPFSYRKPGRKHDINHRFITLTLFFVRLLLRGQSGNFATLFEALMFAGHNMYLAALTAIEKQWNMLKPKSPPEGR